CPAWKRVVEQAQRTSPRSSIAMYRLGELTDNEEEGAERHHRPAVAASLLFGELTEAIHCDRAPGRGPLCLFYHTLPGRAESDATRSGGPFLAFSWQALCSRRRPARH